MNKSYLIGWDMIELIMSFSHYKDIINLRSIDHYHYRHHISQAIIAYPIPIIRITSKQRRKIPYESLFFQFSLPHVNYPRGYITAILSEPWTLKQRTPIRTYLIQRHIHNEYKCIPYTIKTYIVPYHILIDYWNEHYAYYLLDMAQYKKVLNCIRNTFIQLKLI